MSFGSKKPFFKNPFAAPDPILVEVPKGPIETHEKRTAPRRYLSDTSLTDAISGALSPLLPGAPRPSKKVEVERIREVQKAQEAAPTEDSKPTPPPVPPKWGRKI